MSSLTNTPTPSPQHGRGIGLMVFSTFCFTANVLLVRALSGHEHANVWLVSATMLVQKIKHDIQPSLFRCLSLLWLFECRKSRSDGVMT